VNRTEIRITGWNPAFDGLRIAVLSDIHGGANAVTEEKLREIVEVTNAQEPDLIVILGDFVSQARADKPIQQRSLKMPVSTIADNLVGFRAPFGIFAVLGNHDGWYNDENVAAELGRVGINVLQNQAAVIEKGNQRLRILGLRDHFKLSSPTAFDAEIAPALSRSGDSGNLIVLEHSPDVFPEMLKMKPPAGDFNLMLAGHTHGGQVSFPIIGSLVVPSTYGQRYNRGHIRENGKDLFVTTGIGTSILPFRFLVPPEIAILTIYAE